MEDYLDQYFSSTSWSDLNVKESSYWIHGEPDESNTLLPATSLGVYHQDDKNSVPKSMICSNYSLECLAQSTPDLVPSGESVCGVEYGLLSGEGVPKTDVGQNYSSNSIKDQLLNESLEFGNMEQQSNTSVHSSGSLSLNSPKGVSVFGDMMTTPSLSFSERRNVICNGGESSEFQRSLTSLETLSPIPQLWHPQPYDGLASLPDLMEQSRMQSSCLQRENGMADDDCLINRFVEIDQILQPKNLSTSINAKGKQDLLSSLYSSLPGKPQTTMSGLPSLLQTASPTPNNGCNGIGKPRVRARRGQATDPHSIAERLRREKIAERMKNLQLLVPNSNKTDKASMLDKIIEYVKFLQLQIKVLSMSRLGAAGAVVPLITDKQAEGSTGLSLSPLMGQGIDFSPSPDQVVFEQEVVKLMESNLTLAMQYLQTKGLCLMPIALAAALPNGKASSLSSSPSCTASEERKKSGFTKSFFNNDIVVHSTCSSNGIVQNTNCCCSSINSSNSSNGSLPDVGIHHTSFDGKFIIGKLDNGGVLANSFNASFKQEEMHTQCTAK